MGLEIGPLHVRRSTFIRATPARVWAEFETFDRFAAWFGRGHQLHTYEPRLGGTVDLSVEINGARRHYGGAILVFSPEKELSLDVNWRDADLAWPVPMLWTVRLTPLYDGVQAEIFHHGFERLGASAGEELEGYEQGWDVKHLKALRGIVEG